MHKGSYSGEGSSFVNFFKGQICHRQVLKEEMERIAICAKKKKTNIDFLRAGLKHSWSKTGHVNIQNPTPYGRRSYPSDHTRNT